MVDFFNVPVGLEVFVEKLRPALERILRSELGEGKVVSFAFVDSDLIAEMNRTYRGKDGPTDVLTFVYGSSESMTDGEPFAEAYLSLEEIDKNAASFGNSLEGELVTVIIHSILHMAGYDHEFNSSKADEMFEKQKMYVVELCAQLGIGPAFSQ